MMLPRIDIISDDATGVLLTGAEVLLVTVKAAVAVPWSIVVGREAVCNPMDLVQLVVKEVPFRVAIAAVHTELVGTQSQRGVLRGQVRRSEDGKV
jgi:hypothetical protein